MSSSLATILFTDLVDSTGQRARIGDDAADLVVADHDRIVNEAAEAHGGRVVKTLGDGALVEFPSALEAIEAGLEICDAASSHADANEHSFDVRVGVHAGEVSRTDGDLSGLPVAVAARVCGMARGGQVLVTGLVRSLVGSRGGASLTSIGHHELKGVPGPVEIWSVSQDASPPEVEEATAGVAFPAFLARGMPSTLVGRSEEIDALQVAYRAADRGPAALVAIVGEPGIGKTALTSAWADAAWKEGAVVVGGRCTPDASVPFQPFIEIAKSVLESRPSMVASLGPAAGNVAMLVPGLSLGDRVPPPIDADVDTTQYLMAEAFASLVKPQPDEPPSVVVIDDLHWADDASLSVVSQLARSDEEVRSVIVGTYRDTDLVRSHPLSRLLTQLRRETRIERMKLDPLDHAEVGVMVAAQAGGDIETDLVSSILTETKGNPFFVTEMVAHLRDEGAIDGNGRWTSDVPVAQYGIPEGVRDVIGLRVERLGDEAAEFLQAASVVGPTVPVDLVASLVGLDDAGTDEAVDAAIAAGLLDEGDSLDEVVFAHALVRQTLYEELPMRRRMRLHRAAAEALQATGAPAAEVLQHWLAVDDAEEALRWAVRASDEALVGSAQRASMEYLELALELWPDVDDPVQVSERSRAILVIDLTTFYGDFAENFDRAAALVEEEIASGAADPAEAALLHLRMSDHVWQLGDYRRSSEEMESALAIIEGNIPQSVRARVLGVNAGRLTTAGHYEEAIEFGHLALEALGGTREAKAERPAYTALGTSYGALGDVEESEKWFALLLELAEQTGNVRARLVQFMNQGEVYRLNALWDRAVQSFERGIDGSREIGADRWEAALVGNLVDVRHMTGRWDEARRLLEERPVHDQLDFPELTINARWLAASADQGDETAFAATMERLGGYDFSRQESQVNGPAYTGILTRLRWRGELAEAFATSEIAIGSWNDLDQWIDCAPAAALAIGVVADAVEAGEAELSWTDAAVRWHARLMTSRGPDPSVRVWKEVASAELDRIEGRDSRDAWRRALAQVGARPYVEATIQRQLAAAIEAAGEAGPESGELREAARRTAVRLGAKPLLAALDEDAAESSDN